MMLGSREELLSSESSPALIGRESLFIRDLETKWKTFKLFK